MKYKVVPFVMNSNIGQSPGALASQLEDLINKVTSQGWEYIRLELIDGFCMVAVFKKS